MKFFITCYIACLLAGTADSQWTALPLAPAVGGGGLHLLSDGSVLVKTAGTNPFTVNDAYLRLTPNINGSYANGTWTGVTPMIGSRLYFSSQLLPDGRLYVAGGEYGTGGSAAEVYNPLTNTWTATPPPGTFVSDANSEILDDGRVLQALVGGGSTGILLYNPASNAFATGPNTLGVHNESAWVKLPDNSILFVDIGSTNSERYIPATNTWIHDANVPVQLYDQFGFETGGALLLPDGRALFFGSLGHNAYYTPSGTTTPGTWTAAPDFPNAQGQPDAPSAMMVNGIVLCAVSPIPVAGNVFQPPTSFYEFNPVTNIFTSIAAPGGGTSINIPVYETTFLALPDGNILYSQQNSNQFYIYHPTGGPQNAWRPTINTVTLAGTNTYQITGTQFNGLSEGATYGDDWQMNSNYPIVRLVSGTNVYYCRTSNWNSTGVRRGAAADNATFTVPATVPNGNYSLYVVANGIESLPFSFNFGCAADVTITGAYPAPLTESSTWIKSSAQTTVTNTASVKLDADPDAGYVELKPIVGADYFLAAPLNNSALFVAQAFNGCQAGAPNRTDNTPKPIITSTLINGGPSLPPRHKEIIKPGITAIKSTTLEVFPNPARSSFIVRSSDNIRNAELQLVDVNGKLQNITIQNIDAYSMKIKWTYLSYGVYFLKIISSQKTDFVKVVIQ